LIKARGRIKQYCSELIVIVNGFEKFPDVSCLCSVIC
jgi:hypothetical protein